MKREIFACCTYPLHQLHEDNKRILKREREFSIRKSLWKYGREYENNQGRVTGRNNMRPQMKWKMNICMALLGDWDVSPSSGVQVYPSHLCGTTPSSVHTVYGGANCSACDGRWLMNTGISVLWELNLLSIPPTTCCLLQVTLHVSLSPVGCRESHNFCKVHRLLFCYEMTGKYWLYYWFIFSHLWVQCVKH